MAEVKVIQPQAGYQTKCLSSPADIVIGGGAAGAGKTFSLLLEFLRHIRNPGWGGVIFRRTSPQIRSEGGLWDTSTQLYPLVGAEPRQSFLEWAFPSGAKIKFSHLEYEKNVLDWQGAQIPFIGFDELTHFSQKMFFYLISRNRSVCGVRPYIRATCNPDPESWVAEFIKWWIDQDTGYPIPERDGVVRYFIRNGQDFIWGDTPEEVIDQAWFFLEPMVKKSGMDPKQFIKSATFIAGDIYENRELLDKDPAYLANLVSQDEDTKKALLDGNWKVSLSERDIYEYYSFCDMFDNSFSARDGKKYITADIALQGSDKFIIGVWDGYELIDIEIYPKSDTREVLEAIKAIAKKHKVPNRNICFDNDGVGSYLKGFMPQSIPFVNNSKALNNENYENLKAQCYYKSGESVTLDLYRVSEKVADTMYDDKMTVRQRMMYERKAIKKGKVDLEGKLALVSKAEMKSKLNGQSPDIMDMFMMRERFELRPSARVDSSTF